MRTGFTTSLVFQSHFDNRISTRNNFMLMWQKFHVRMLFGQHVIILLGSNTHFHYQFSPKLRCIISNTCFPCFMWRWFFCGVDLVDVVLKPNSAYSFMPFSIFLWCWNLCPTFWGIIVEFNVRDVRIDGQGWEDFDGRLKCVDGQRSLNMTFDSQ